jgi:hypothetical protein
MHPEAYDGFGRMLRKSGLYLGNWRILDVGGADVNGSVRDYFPGSTIEGVDIGAAPGVDYVFDAAVSDNWKDLRGKYDIVFATELFEHAEFWADIIANMATALDPEGMELFFATCASTGRPPHGSRGEWGVPAGQFYGNVAPDDLERELNKHFRHVYVEYQANPGDAYMWAHGAR